MNVALWERLTAQCGRHFPASELAASLDRGEEQLFRDVAALVSFGFGIECHPYLGLLATHPARNLCPDQIAWGLQSEIVGRRLSVWNRVGSTNDLAARAAGSAANEGLVVLAEEQTAGRGRRGRTWFAPATSSLLASVLLFPPDELCDPAMLTALAAVAVAELVGMACGRPARIKWPNDVQVADRKLAGILVEQSGAAYVLGIGINVNISGDEFPPEMRRTAATLCEFTGYALDRSRLARLLLQRLDGLYHLARQEGAKSVWSRYEHLAQRSESHFEPSDGQAVASFRSA